MAQAVFGNRREMSRYISADGNRIVADPTPAFQFSRREPWGRWPICSEKRSPVRQASLDSRLFFYSRDFTAYVVIVTLGAVLNFAAIVMALNAV